MAAQYAVQIECRTDQRKMREGLGEITERLSLRTCLFCVKPEMICITQHSFKHEPGLVELFRASFTRACQCFHAPAGAHVQCGFFPGKPVNARLGRITVDQAVADEPSVTRALENSGHGAEHSRIVRSHEKNQWHNQ